MATFVVTRKDGSELQVTAAQVHVTAQGHVKFLNNPGRNAEVVAFFNAENIREFIAVEDV